MDTRVDRCVTLLGRFCARILHAPLATRAHNVRPGQHTLLSSRDGMPDVAWTFNTGAWPARHQAG